MSREFPSKLKWNEKQRNEKRRVDSTAVASDASQDVVQPAGIAPPAPIKARKKGKDITRVAHTIFCCQASACSRNGARLTWKSLRHQVRSQGLKSDVQMVKTHCTGLCKHGPILIVCASHSPYDGVVWYSGIKPEDAALITREHLANNRIVEGKRHNSSESATSSEVLSREDASKDVDVVERNMDSPVMVENSSSAKTSKLHKGKSKRD